MARITTTAIAPLKHLSKFWTQPQTHQIRRATTNLPNHPIQKYKPYTRVPRPTWSLDELNLTSSPNDATITTDEELDALAQRCLLDVKNIPESERHRLKVELSKIMKCLALVCEVSAEQESGTALPHSGGSCPVRDEPSERNAWKRGGRGEEARGILDVLAADGKLVRVENGRGEEEEFFSISMESGGDGD